MTGLISRRSLGLVAAWMGLVLGGACHPVHRSTTPIGGGAVQRFDVAAAVRRLEGRLAQTKDACGQAALLSRIGWLHLLHDGNSRAAAKAFDAASKRHAGAWAALGSALVRDDSLQRTAAARGYVETLAALEAVGQSACGAKFPLAGARCYLARLASARLSALVDQDVVLPNLESRLTRLADRIACPWAGIQLRRAAGRLARRRGDAAALDAMTKDLGCPTKWRKSHRFGATGESDLLRRFPAEGPGGFVRTGRCGLRLAGEDGHPGLKRAKFAFRTDKDAKMIVWIDAGRRNVRVTLDGVEVHAPAGRFDWPPALVRVCAEFRAGLHRVAVTMPVGMADHELSAYLMGAGGRRLAVRFVDPQGVAAPAQSHLCQSPAWPARLKAGPGFDLLRNYLVMVDESLFGRRDRAEAAANELLGSRFVPGLIGAALLDVAPYGLSERERYNRGIVLLSRALQVDERAARASWLRSKLRILAGHPDRALDEANRWLARSKSGSGSGLWWLRRARVLRDKSWLAMADQAVREGTRRLPRSRSAWRLMMEIARQRDDLPGQKAAIERLSLLDRSSDLKARFQMRVGQPRKAAVTFRRLLRLEPSAHDLIEGLARAEVQAGRYARAYGRYQGLMTRQLWNPDLRLSAANALLELGRRAEARRLLETGMRYRPSSIELRRSVMGIDKGLFIDSFRVDGAKIAMRFEHSDQNREQGRGALMTLDRTVDWVLEGGGLVELSHQIVKVRSSADLSRWGQIQVPYGVVVLRMRAIKPDGSIRQPEEPSAGEPVHLVGLEVGDYVELESITARPPIAVLQGGFMGRRFFFASLDAATAGSEYILITPRAMNLQVDRRAGAPKATERSKGSWRITTWHGRARPRFERISHAPPYVQIVPSVRVGASVTWKTLSGLVASRLWTLDRPSIEMRRIAKQICSSGSEMDRARRAYRWVQDHLNQSGTLYDTAAEAVARRRGYRLTVLRALLGLCRVRTSLVMVMPRHREADPGAVPDLTAYRYPVLEVGDPHRRTFLFPFLREMPFGFLPSMLRGARAVRVLGGPVEEMKTPRDAGRDEETMKVAVHLDRSGDAVVTVRESLTGWPGIQMRRAIRNLTRRRFMNLFESRRLAAHFPGARLSGKPVVSMDKRHRDRVVLSYRFRVAGFARRLGGRLMIRRSFYGLRLAATFLRERRRTVALQVGAFPAFRFDLNVVGPVGWRVEMSGGSRKASSRWGSVVRRLAKSRKAGRPVVSVQIARHIPLSWVPPDQYDAFARFARRSGQVEQILIIFGKGDHGDHGVR
ncbi:MAG: tetratricopeptide repeat protein [Deltaproteobacteria bacterium]|nr:tetratricopeptide repeat protein [Deltaproteobacteria bacterium]